MFFKNKFASCSDSFVFNADSICNALRILSLLLGYNFLPKILKLGLVYTFLFYHLLLVNTGICKE